MPGVVEHQRDSPKCSVFCAISPERVYWPFFFNERTVTGIVYRDRLEQWLLPQLPENQNYVFQQDGCSAHFHNEIRLYLNNMLPRRWLGRASEDDKHLLLWSPGSPDLTPCDFFLWGYIKDRVYVLPMPCDIADVRERIIAAVNTIDRPMLIRVWQELAYRVNVCRVTCGICRC